MLFYSKQLEDCVIILFFDTEMVYMKVFKYCLLILTFVNAYAEKALICGVCRSIEKAFPTTRMQMEKMGDLFEDYRILIYENNSKDRTKEFLKKWSQENQRVWVKSENLTRVDLANLTINSILGFGATRIEQITRARNIVLSEALSKQYDDYTYIIWYDMDFEEAFDVQVIVEVIQSDKEWDGVFANGVLASDERYWDKLAFRNEPFLFGPELLGDLFWKEMPVFNYHFDETLDWIPVVSAFGGLGIYKREALKGCKYSAFVDEKLEEFYLNLIERGEVQGWESLHELYLTREEIKETVLVEGPSKNLPLKAKSTGFILGNHPNALIWRLAKDDQRYPIVCEHVYLHALMTLNGRSKFFINPRMKLKYY